MALSSPLSPTARAARTRSRAQRILTRGAASLAVGAAIVASIACSAGDDQRVVVVPGWGASAPGAPSAAPAAGGPDAGSSSAGGTTSPTPSPVAASGVPCDVATILTASCTSCHADPPIAGSLAGLVTYSDLMATAHEDATKNEAQVSLARMQNASSPMPPGGLLPAAAITTLKNWIDAGYPKGAACGAAGGGSGADAGATPAPAPASVFTGAPAFVAQTGPTTHNAGLDCMGCHGGTVANAPSFEFGGTLYDGSGNPVVGAEVRFVDGSGKAASVYTSSTGTFYESGTGFTGPANVGARNAAGAHDMITALQSGAQSPASSGGACSACHCSGTGCTQGLIHLP